MIKQRLYLQMSRMSTFHFIAALGVNNRWTHRPKISFHTNCSINATYQDKIFLSNFN